MITSLLSMPPRKGSKALNKKHQHLGTFQKNKKSLNEMESKILEQKKEMEAKENEYLQNKQNLDDIQKNISHLSSVINNKKRQLDHKHSTLANLSNELQDISAIILSRKKKYSYHNKMS